MSQAVPEARSSPRRGGRVGRRQARDAAVPDRRIYRRLRNPYPPIEVLSEDQVEAIHDASVTIMEEIGIRVRLPEARQILKQAGATVDEAGEIVRFGRDFVDETMATAPEVVTLHARNPDATVETGRTKSPSPRSADRRTSRTWSTAGGPVPWRISGISCAWRRPMTSSTSSARPPSRWISRCRSGISR